MRRHAGDKNYCDPDDHGTDVTITRASFLEATRQPAEAVTGFWEPIIVSACNMGISEVAGNLAIKVFQDGFLAGSWQSTIGLPRTDLRAMYEPAAERIEASGGVIRHGVSAHGIAYDGHRVSGVVTDEGMVYAKAVVSAVPPDRLAKPAAKICWRMP